MASELAQLERIRWVAFCKTLPEEIGDVNDSENVKIAVIQAMAETTVLTSTRGSIRQAKKALNVINHVYMPLLFCSNNWWNETVAEAHFYWGLALDELRTRQGPEKRAIAWKKAIEHLQYLAKMKFGIIGIVQENVKISGSISVETPDVIDVDVFNPDGIGLITQHKFMSDKSFWSRLLDLYPNAIWVDHGSKTEIALKDYVANFTTSSMKKRP